MDQYGYSTSSTGALLMRKVYLWMSVALAITAGVAYYVFSQPALFKSLTSSPGIMFGLIIAQLALVIGLSFFIMRMSLFAALAAFITYAALVGLTLSVIFGVYTESSIYATFAITAGMFAVTALYGYTTDADLTSFGSFGLMALFGLIIGGVVNMFLQSEAFDYVISFFGVIVFTLLTAYDVQKLKYIGQSMVADRETMGKVAVIGALTLYLDFINLFLYLLRFLGKQKDR